jgi:hypothetical protein
VTPGTASRFAGLRSLPSAAYRALGLGIGFVVVVAAVFAGVGAWQDRPPGSPEPVAAPAPTPTPTPPPAAAPEPEDGDDDADTPDEADDADEVDEAPVDPPAVSGPRPADVSVQLLNGIGADGSTGVARVRTTLTEAGFRIAATRDARAYDITTIFYTVGFEAEARLVGQVLGVSAIRPMTDLPPERRLSSSVMVHVVVGSDRR